MKYKKKIHIVRWFLLFFGFSFVVYLISQIFFHGAPKRFSKEFETSSKLAYAKGISFVEYHGDKKVYSVSIDSFHIERARIGPFAIGPFHIVHLNKVNIELYQDGMESKLGQEIQEGQIQQIEKKDEILNFDRTLMDIRKKLPAETKKVKGIEIKEVSINLWNEGKRIFRITSNTATIDRKTRDLIFTGQANLDAGDNGKLTSHRIRWDKKTRLFRVTDPYHLIRNGKKTEGKGIETDYLLKKVSYLSSAK